MTPRETLRLVRERLERKDGRYPRRELLELVCGADAVLEFADADEVGLWLESTPAGKTVLAKCLPPSALDEELPYDADAERGVLGAVALHAPVLEDVLGIGLKTEDFYDDAHQRLFKAMLDMHTDGSVPGDVVLLLDRLRRTDDFDRVGGAAYVGRIINAVPNYQHAVYYAEIVKRKADLRRIIYAGVAWVKAAYEENQEPAVLVEEMRRRLEKIT